MDRQMLDVGLPMLYGLIIVVLAMTTDGVLGVVTVVGAMLLGLYYAAIRPSLIRKERAGQDGS